MLFTLLPLLNILLKKFILKNVLKKIPMPEFTHLVITPICSISHNVLNVKDLYTESVLFQAYGNFVKSEIEQKNLIYY